MIADRPYMRDPSDRGRWSVTGVLIVTLIALFLVQAVLKVYGKFDPTRQLALSLEGIRHYQYWQLLTYQFLHSAPWPWHVLGNCLVLYFFGGALEELIGPRRMLKLYFAGGFLGGGLQLLHMLVISHWLPQERPGGVVGASAGVSALLAGYCALFPEREGCFVIYFFPVRVKAKYVLMFVLALSAFGMIFPFDYVAHAAHMGGLLCGIAYAKGFHESNVLADLWQRFRQRRRSKPIVKVRFPRSNSWKAEAASSRPMEDPDFISKEVDPILEKISAHGIHSLTEREKEILEKARSRMGKM